MSRWSGLWLAACYLLSLSPVHADPVPALLLFVPEGANSVAVLRVHDLTGSPRGREQGWAERHAEGDLDGAVTIPPWVEVLVRASYVRPGTQGGEWTVVLLPLPDEYEMSALAEREGAEVQEIVGRPAVYSPRRHGYFVELQGTDAVPRILGGKAPATRQEVARWIAAVHGASRPGLSSYLQEAVVDAAAQIIMAIDLHEMLDPVHIRYRLEGADVLRDRPQVRNALTLDFQTLRGLQLAVQVRETATAEFRFDFGRDIGAEAEYVKPLFIEYLHDVGAVLDEVEQATVHVAGKSVTLRMPLSDESLRRILSLFTAPPPPARVDSAPTETPRPAPQRPGIDAAASLRYFRAVNRNIDDLQRAYRRAESYTRTAQWHENFARRIEDLPIAGVDPELIEYGERISSYFRGLADSLRGTAVRIDTQERRIVYHVQQRPVYHSGIEWWWGGARTPWGPYTYRGFTATEGVWAWCLA